MASDSYRVRTITDKSKKGNPGLQAFIDLSNTERPEAQDPDPDLKVIKDMLGASPEWPLSQQVCAENTEVKNLWSQYLYFKICDGVLTRRHKNQGPLDVWQVVTPQSIQIRIFQSCHHHKLEAHQT